MSSSIFNFPANFAWGAATSSYQIEGAWNKHGKGESIWDRFSHTAGTIADGSNGDTSCDHYHRYAEDIKLMRRLGLTSYRFSVSWPRILPEGRGQVNSKGLDFYERLVDALLAAGIEPFLTLYHWDLPQPFQEKGGWLNRDVCHYFQDYTSILIERLSDRVKYWTTINEPWVIANLGYGSGEMAPGLKDEKLALQVSHNLLLAHGLSLQAIRALAPAVQAGIVLILAPTEPADDSEAAARAAEFAWRKDGAWYLDPLFHACYPEDVWQACADKAPLIKDGDLQLISQKMDYLGVNYYFRAVINAKGKRLEKISGSKYTAMGWEIYPDGLSNLLERINKDYSLPPIYITENGAAFDDVLANGQVHDQKRIDYLYGHLLALHNAIKNGVDLRGYFCWSLLDNFEWAYGFSKRFGLIYIDYKKEQTRLLKDSALWYAKVIERNGIAQEAFSSDW
ncbi:MAG: beta-glucosidase [Candidatus Obscuribacterales bacterium]|nr:beta-glucosidase [Candidatus Obscuribacterales bacterium]